MSTSILASTGRFLILPVLFAALVAISIQGHGLDQHLPHWETLLTLATVFLMERLYANSKAVSQKGRSCPGCDVDLRQCVHQRRGDDPARPASAHLPHPAPVRA